MTGDTLESNGLSHKRFIAIFVTAGAVSGRKYALFGSERAFSVSENAPFYAAMLFSSPTSIFCLDNDATRHTGQWHTAQGGGCGAYKFMRTLTSLALLHLVYGNGRCKERRGPFSTVSLSSIRFLRLLQSSPKKGTVSPTALSTNGTVLRTALPTN